MVAGIVQEPLINKGAEKQPPVRRSRRIRVGTTQLESVPEPKYWHLKTVLAEALDTDFAVGEILPNERDLAARFGVARATLRQALEQLELEGRLQRRRGVGTTGTDAWQAAECTVAVPSAAVARLLDTETDEAVHTVRRLRMSHGQPVAAELLYVPSVSVPDLPAIDAPSGPALARSVLRELQRLGLEGQDRAVELGSAGAVDAKELDRLPGAPVLVVTTRYFSEGRTAAVSVATYRADTCRLTFGGDVEISHPGQERHAS
jgi:DNA-binding GntR family transcriptional regulator